MKICLCTVPAEGFGKAVARGRSEGEFPVIPKVAIVSLIKWMERAGYSSDDCDFFDIDMLLPGDGDIRKHFDHIDPAVVGLSATVSTSFQQVKRISKIVRQTNPDTWIVMGGMLAASSEAVLHTTDVDICIAGDGEIAWLDFLGYVQDHERQIVYEALEAIQGLCFLDRNGELYCTGYGSPIPAADISFPDYDILAKGLTTRPEAINNYFRPGRESSWFAFDPRARDSTRRPNLAGLFVSKGCVAKCTFCQRSTKGYRTLNLDALRDHLETLTTRFDVGFINILDENFGSDKRQAYEVARLLKEFDLLWIVTGVRVTSTNYEDLKFYQDHNCSGYKFGVESGSQKILDIMEKKFTVADVTHRLQECAKLDLYSPLALMVGMPGETEDTARATGKLIGETAYMLGVHPKHMLGDLFHALPLPGTPLYEYGERVGVVDSSPEGTARYLENVSDAYICKRFYVNLNGAPIAEMLFWDWLVMLESSRIYHEKCDERPAVETHIGKTFREVMERELSGNPRYQLKHREMKFTFITRIFDTHVYGNPIVDKIPRRIIYPVLKYLGWFEFVVQSCFPENRRHNIFVFQAAANKVKRISDKYLQGMSRSKDRSLRQIATGNNAKPLLFVDEPQSSVERSRLLLTRGL